MPPARSASVILTLFAASDCFAANFLVTTTAAGGVGSLAAAITSANATAAADTITFAIPGLGDLVITADLPAVTQPLTIDGYTQAFSLENSVVAGATNANLRIVLDGSALPAGEPTLQIDTGPTVVRGLELRGIQDGAAGIRVGASAEDVSILGCFVGVQDGTVDSSDGIGILVDGLAIIGTTLVEDRNLISGNDDGGIVLRGASSVVANNLIGTSKDGLSAIANGAGIVMTTAAASNNNVGGFGPQAWNVIAGNTRDGIRIESSAGDANAILFNSIRDNGGLGIDLGPDGVTPNDLDDLDDGPNGLQNYPELSFARVNGPTLRLEGFLNSQPGSYTIEVYLAGAEEPGGFAEGATPIDSFAVPIADGETIAHFSLPLDAAGLPTEEFGLVATARGAESDGTSEFSRQVRVMFGGDPLLVTSTADSGAGSLRAAIDEANADVAPNTIVFDIAGKGPHTILPLSTLAITEPLLVDGYSQPFSLPNTLAQGSNADIRIVVDGSQLPGGAAAAFEIAASDSALRGIAIHSAPNDGIRLTGGLGQRIEGNFIGTDRTGAFALGNGAAGINAVDAQNLRIGGPSPGQRNVISGNDEEGILTSTRATTILNNIVGPSAGGAALGNGADGIVVNGLSARIGSDESGLGNVIRGNTLAGIAVLETAEAGNEFLGNSIEANGGLGIDLLRGIGQPVTANDEDDEDEGPNGLQNFPVIETVTQGAGQLTIEGSLDVPAAGIHTPTIRVFASPSCDPLGHGEGVAYLGKSEILVNQADEQFMIRLPIELAGTVQLTATASEGDGHSTSEFSQCFVFQATGVCGDFNGDESIAASDALGVLRAAVGSTTCALCVCDVNSAGGINTTDALFVLRKAVGQDVELNCPDCG